MVFNYSEAVVFSVVAVSDSSVLLDDVLVVVDDFEEGHSQLHSVPVLADSIDVRVAVAWPESSSDEVWGEAVVSTVFVGLVLHPTNTRHVATIKVLRNIFSPYVVSQLSFNTLV